MEWYLKVLKNWSVFDGRARRTEYWMFQLISFLFVFAVEILGFVAAFIIGSTGAGVIIWIFLICYGLAVILPMLAVTVRRLHDTDKSGAWFLIIFVPLIGPIVHLVFMCTDGTPGPNRYGPNPKSFAQDSARVF